MPDDRTKKGKQDRDRIALNEKHEVAYAAKSMGTTEANVRAAVKAVGPMRKDVAKAVKKG
jgi:hypothetical protein